MSAGGSTASSASRVVAFSITIAASCVLLAGLITGDVPALEKTGLPLGGLVVLIVLVPATPALIRNWKISLLGFFVWLMVEDLFRKFAGNNITTYFAKDLFLAIVLLGFVLDPATKGAWRRATGQARIALYCLGAWALVMSIATGLTDWRLPLLGLRVDFLYAPLVAVGFMIAQDRVELARWLGRLSIITAATSAVGIIQATIGPTFLRPNVATPGLLFLDLTRVIGNTEVFRPTGTFVEPGRFLSMALIGLTISLGALFFVKGRWKSVVGGCAVINVVAVWVSGGRTGVIEGIVLLGLAAIAPAFAERKPALSRALVVALGVGAAYALLSVAAPALITSRTAWYVGTIGPNARVNEFDIRWTNYSTDTVRGIEIGGLIGLGTGQSSLGKQYLYGGEGYDPSTSGLYLVEGGYAAVAVEWGVIGLVLWLVFSIAWFTRQVRSVIAARGDRIAAFGLLVLGWMAFLLFIAFFGGIANFQNYISNVFFWFLSGVLFAAPSLARRAAAHPVSSVAEPIA